MKANRDFLVSLDNQLRAVDLSLASFAPQQRVKALDATEERYFVEEEDRASGLARKRSCVKNTTTGQRRYECPIVVKAGHRHHPSWHMTLDMGTIGWPGSTFLIYGLGIRGTQSWDRCHRVKNDVGDGVAEAGLGLIRLEFASLLTLRNGPFGRGANHRVLEGEWV